MFQYIFRFSGASNPTFLGGGQMRPMAATAAGGRECNGAGHPLLPSVGTKV